MELETAIYVRYPPKPFKEILKEEFTVNVCTYNTKIKNKPLSQ